jgi:hypothetical protein
MEPATYHSKTSPWIIKCFEASTSHITKEDDAILKKEDAPLAVYTYEFGYFVYALGESEKTEDLLKAGFSNAFCNLLDRARQLDCKFLQLDCDGVTYTDLPTFEW